eukprot:scaffold25052_cov110-Isochrysis_galbana.AAC.4
MQEDAHKCRFTKFLYLEKPLLLDPPRGIRKAYGPRLSLRTSISGAVRRHGRRRPPCSCQGARGSAAGGQWVRCSAGCPGGPSVQGQLRNPRIRSHHPLLRPVWVGPAQVCAPVGAAGPLAGTRRCVAGGAGAGASLPQRHVDGAAAAGRPGPRALGRPVAAWCPAGNAARRSAAGRAGCGFGRRAVVAARVARRPRVGRGVGGCA